MRQVADGKKLFLCREVFTPDGPQPPARGESLKKSVFLKESEVVIKTFLELESEKTQRLT